MMTIYFLLILSLTICNSEWIDPFSMNTEVDPAVKELISNKVDGNYALILSHYKRYINFLLNALRHDMDSDNYKGRINVEIDGESYKFLKDFSMGNEMETDWREVDLILSQVFYKSTREKMNEFVLSWRDQLMVTVYSYEFRVTAFVLLATFLVYKLSKQTFHFKDLIKYLLLFIFIIDFAFTYIRLIQEKEVENVTDSMQYSSAPECDPKKMSAMQYFSYLTNNNENCKNYYKLQYIDILWAVNPLKVLGHQWNDLIVTPAKGLGEAFGQFTQALISNMPWYMSITLPIILIFVIICVCIFFSFITKTSFGFNFFYLIHLNFGQEPAQPRSVERPQVQEIRFIQVERSNSAVREVGQGDGAASRSIKEHGEKTTVEIVDVGPREEKDCAVDEDSKLLEDCPN